MYRLVIVDDENIVVRGLQVLLQQMKIPAEVVGTAADGKTALAVIREKRPDVVITDIRIPYMDGLSLIESCKEFLPATDYIVISGYQDFEYARKALQLGTLDYIDKPVTKDKLRDAFVRLAERRKRLGRRAGIPENAAGETDQTGADRMAEETLRSGMPAEHPADATGMAPEPDGTGRACPQGGKRENHGAITRVLTYIQENYARDIGLSELADLVEMSPAYLSVLFKENVGTSFVKYLTRLRMEKAKELLAAGRKVSDVGAAVGYNDPHYFYETFKKNTGMTPSEYRDSVILHQ